MPELLTKDPAAALEVLRSEGATCGVGITPKVLTSCPQDRLCVFRGGELCVYGARELGLMTELSRQDVCGPVPEPASVTGMAAPALGIGIGLAAVLGFAFVSSRARRKKTNSRG
jgi:hypothetical protein